MPDRIPTQTIVTRINKSNCTFDEQLIRYINHLTHCIWIEEGDDSK